MQGGVRKRGKKWYYYFDLGVVDGKRKKVERVGGTTKKEAEKALRDSMSEYDNEGKLLDESGISFSDYLDYWIKNYVDINCKFNTRRIYLHAINKHIIPNIGMYKIKNLNTPVIQNFINSLRDKLSLSSMKLISVVIKSSLDYAVYPANLIKISPYRHIKLPRVDRTEEAVKTITQEQFDKLLELTPEGTTVYIPMQLGYHTGMRAGEVLALTWDDVDLKQKTIDINKTLIYSNESTTRNVIGTPKTKSSYRVIPIGDKLTNILKKYKNRQKELKLKYDQFYQDADNVIPNIACTYESGKQVSIRNLNYIITSIKKHLDFEFTFHVLRHTHATMLIQNDVNPKEVQNRLGHANINITLDTYTHSDDTSSRKVANIFDSLVK
jgi:integrase